MKQLFCIEDGLANKISYFHIMLFLVSLPFDMFYSHIILISLIAHTLIHLRKKDIKPVISWRNMLLSSVFFLTLLSLIYTGSRPEGLNELSMQVTILLLPLVFSLNPLDLGKYRDNLLQVFMLTCAAVTAYLFLHALVTIGYYHQSLPLLFTPAFLNHNFSLPVGMHATYLAMQVAVALVYALYLLTKATTSPQRLFYLACCGLLAAGIIQLSSRAVFIALFLVINLAVPYFLLSGKRRLRFVMVVIPLSLLIIAGIYTASNFRERYVTELEKDLRRGNPGELTDPRMARWDIAMRIGVQSPVIGYGAGSEVALLREGYFQHKFYRSYLTNLNAHNQFISFFIKFGTIGLLIFVCTLVYGFRASFRHKDLLLFAFLAVTTAVCLSENIMDRDKGIFFYAAFFSLLIFSHYPIHHKESSALC
ncbi:O-antigen ligase family protein [Chitinophaga agrisoli]|uniref:O-antigen ligase family protein n=1 Tax=Chitinophaga agrisoli TaxID=2607653 RepID=A0A5B2VK14_9BACT|nr:O-antigen ligase family protein [Chitinophaga agrisoli]KAA2239018.1 O-antigen ligase family protein [Chitinophaga agrisoli]